MRRSRVRSSPVAPFLNTIHGCFFPTNIKSRRDRLYDEEGNFFGWDKMSTTTEKKSDTRARIKELQTQVDDLKELVNTLLSVIVEEPDGVHTGSAPTGGHPLANTCM
jgi:hypothetical protein